MEDKLQAKVRVNTLKYSPLISVADTWHFGSWFCLRHQAKFWSIRWDWSLFPDRHPFASQSQSGQHMNIKQSNDGNLTNTLK